MIQKGMLHGIISLDKRNDYFDRPVDRVEKPIIGFYHIFCGPNDWEGIVTEQITILERSLLLQNVQSIYVTLIGNEYDRAKCKRLLTDKRFIIAQEYTDGSCFEFPSLKLMKKLAASQSFYAFYFHTKGASYSKDMSSNINFEWKRIQCDRWRQLMNFWVLTKWQMAYNVLSEGSFCSYGILIREFPSKHYSGNFWWTTSEHINTTVGISNEFMADRYNAEFWLLRNLKDLNRAYSPFKRGLLCKINYNCKSPKMYAWWNWRNIVYLLMAYTYSKE